MRSGLGFCFVDQLLLQRLDDGGCIGAPMFIAIACEGSCSTHGDRRKLMCSVIVSGLFMSCSNGLRNDSFTGQQGVLLVSPCEKGGSAAVSIWHSHKSSKFRCAITACACNVEINRAFCLEWLKLTVAELQRLADLSGYRLLSEGYVNNYTHTSVLCDVGRLWYVQPKHLKEGRRCPDC